MQGRIQDFHLGEEQQIMCAHAHHERKARSPLRPGSRTRLRALEALGTFDALSCYLSLIFKHSDTKWDKKTHSRSNLRGGARPPLDPPLIRVPIGVCIHGRLYTRISSARF